MKKLIKFLFEKTPLFAYIDGKKRVIGFLMWLTSYLILGASELTGLFPGVLFFPEAHALLAELYASVGGFLEDMGFGLLVLGVGHSAAKEKK